MSIRSLIPVFADQLSPDLSCLRAGDPDQDHILMMEVRAEGDQVWHHRKKLVYLFSAMRHHARILRHMGWRVDYIALDDPRNSGNFTQEIGRAVNRLGPERILLTEPGEWRVKTMAQSWRDDFNIPVDMLEDDRFLCSHEEFQDWARDRKQLRMEYFYRDMRRKTGLLMKGSQPLGDRWNFDPENRKTPKEEMCFTPPAAFPPDSITREVIDLVTRHFPDRIGKIRPFRMAVERAQAEEAARQFIQTALPRFGDYQDAMLGGQPFMAHSLLSAYINTGLLEPLKLCRMAEQAYHDGHAPLNAVEGFIRQILGWREYVRGIYWLKMPEYAGLNALDAQRDLPGFYWTGDTGMSCMRTVINETMNSAYAHHIQRLMITGNFALLAGINPYQLHEWYLAVYADAFEWVEMPNTIGMSQFADDGLLGSKPYAASGNYINRMSDYCRGCLYDVKDRDGPMACPFNSLYWHFMDRHRDRLAANPRLSNVYRNWDRLEPDKQSACLSRAETVLGQLNTGGL